MRARGAQCGLRYRIRAGQGETAGAESGLHHRGHDGARESPAARACALYAGRGRQGPEGGPGTPPPRGGRRGLHGEDLPEGDPALKGARRGDLRGGQRARRQQSRAHEAPADAPLHPAGPEQCRPPQPVYHGERVAPAVLLQEAEDPEEPSDEIPGRHPGGQRLRHG